MKPWIKSKIPTVYLLLILSVGLLGLISVEYSKERSYYGAVSKQIEAAEHMAASLGLLKEKRLSMGIPIDDQLDPNQTGIIGDVFTELTTSLGNLEAKRTSTNPEFAALLVRYFQELGLKEGDVVAIGASGSFPGLILATLCATKALDLEPLIIYSIGSSMYGANIPQFTFIQMLDVLRDAKLLPYELLAVSLGGDLDLAQGPLLDGAEDIFRTLAENAAAPFIEEPTISASIRRRQEFYEEAGGGRKISCFVNIGGASPNYGTTAASLHFPNGLVLEPPPGPNDSEVGLIYEYSRAGIPVIHLLDIRDLALKHGIEIDPVPFSKLGSGNVFYELTYRSGLVLGIVLTIFIGLFVFRTKSM